MPQVLVDDDGGFLSDPQDAMLFEVRASITGAAKAALQRLVEDLRPENAANLLRQIALVAHSQQRLLGSLGLAPPAGRQRRRRVDELGDLELSGGDGTLLSGSSFDPETFGAQALRQMTEAVRPPQREGEDIMHLVDALRLIEHLPEQDRERVGEGIRRKLDERLAAPALPVAVGGAP